jgi:hypothetical protein
MIRPMKNSVSANVAEGETAVVNTLAGQPLDDVKNEIFGAGSEKVKRFIQLYLANPLFEGAQEQVISDNPYRRPINSDSIQRFDFSTPLTRGEVFGGSWLAANQMLLNIYESELLFLPDADFGSKRKDFALFYSDETKLLGELIRPTLEAHVFGFLEDQIDVTGKWTADALKSYLRALCEQHEASQLDIVTAVLSSREPEKAAASLLIQVAGDFLTEASASARNILGKYGPIQSELFKILIDDYGYGVHRSKHSTLFEKTMESCGLSSQAHAYWSHYLGSSLALGNYYHHVSRNHSKFFRYIGAFAFAEAMFSHTCRQIAEMLRKVFGSSAETYYFDEHYHIDAHHGRMAFESLVIPSIANYGNGIAEEIVRGLEEVRLLTLIADEDFIAQSAWYDKAGSYKEVTPAILRRIANGEIKCKEAAYTESRGKPSVMQVADDDQICLVKSGAMEWVAGFGQHIRLDAGESVLIPRHRLRGKTILSDDCVYQMFSIGEYEKEEPLTTASAIDTREVER